MGPLSGKVPAYSKREETDAMIRARLAIGLSPFPPERREVVIEDSEPIAPPAGPAPAPVSRTKDWASPERKAERARRRAKWAESRIRKGREEEETRRRATEAAYREAIRA